MSCDHRPGGESRPAAPRAGSLCDCQRRREFRLSVEGQEMLVSYEPYWSDGEFPVGHFEFRSPYEPPRRVPVSETGYRSHFAAMADIEACENAETYARLLVEATLDRAPKSKSGSSDNDQLKLF
jgi:hypothetical protein